MKATPHSIPINPKLPKNFDCTDNNNRPASHMRWWNRPYIETYVWGDMSWQQDASAEAREKWFAAWPSGTRYDVRCLDGGAWDRPTSWGMFATLDEAIQCAKHGRNFG